MPRRPALGVLPLLLLALPACQTPAARVDAYGPNDHVPPRAVLLTRQLVADSAMELAHRPARGVWGLLGAGCEWVHAAVRDVAASRVAFRFTGTPPPLAEDRPTLDPVALEETLCRLVEKPLRPAAMRLHVGGGEALHALQEVIAGAERRIDVLMFLWEHDSLGDLVAARLAERAAQGVRVRVLVDGGGNLIFGEPKRAGVAELNAAIAWLARQPNVELVRIRNPFGRFDHRKLVLADGRMAWTGGRNFTHTAFYKQHDLSLTLTGPLVDELQECYQRYWTHQGGGDAAEPAVASAGGSPPTGVNAHARLVGTEPHQPNLARALYHAIDQARHHVYVENPYLNDGRLICKLVQARRRGADVRVILTITSDVPLIDRANRVVANRLMDEGVRVYVYPGMTHAKAAAVDGLWAYVGTGNFDPLSLRYNRELGVSIGGGPLLAELEDRLFRPDLRPEWELKEPLPTTVGDYCCELLASLCL